jgi:TatD DNase family protein
MYFDTHAHLDDKRFAEDKELVIERARASGVELILNVGYNIQHARNTVEMTKSYDFIYGSVGVHPHDAKALDDAGLQELHRMVKEPKIVAVGEVGLDYYWNNSPIEIQKKVFREMIAFAKEVRKPIIIHDRDAHQDVFDILKAEGAQEVGGVFHCYSGSWPLAREAIKMGFYISLAGPLTFNNASKLHEVVKMVSLDYLLIETDCPYLAPMPFRGKRNEPSYVIKVAEKLAEIKGVSIEEVARKTTENGKKLFNIK